MRTPRITLDNPAPGHRPHVWRRVLGYTWNNGRLYGTFMSCECGWVPDPDYPSDKYKVTNEAPSKGGTSYARELYRKHLIEEGVLPKTEGSEKRPVKKLWLTLVVIIIDQLTKMLAEVTFPNSEFALGMPAPEPGWMVAAMVVGIIAFAMLITFTHAPAWVFAFVIGGAVSNLADRLAYGSVRDFIVVGDIAFNLADIFILAGLVGWVLSLPRKEVTPP